MKTKFKAVKRYLGPGGSLSHHGCVAWKRRALHKLNRGEPIFVLPATPEAYEAMVEAIARVDWKNDGMGNGFHWSKAGGFQVPYRKSAQIALAAIGIRKPSAKGHANE